MELDILPAAGILFSRELCRHNAGAASKLAGCGKITEAENAGSRHYSTVVSYDRKRHFLVQLTMPETAIFLLKASTLPCMNTWPAAGVC